MNVGILGIGNLGSSILNGLVKADKKDTNLYAYDKSNKSKLKGDGVIVVASEEELFKLSDIIIIAVKPASIKEVLYKLPQSLSNKTIISAAAGMPIDFIKENLRSRNIKIYRIMTNLGCEFNSAPILVAGDVPLDAETQDILSLLGKIYQVNEQLLDSLTTIVGSGPALISYFLDSLVQYCKIMGLEGDASREIVNMVALSTSNYLIYKKITYEGLIERVSTPGGITLKALHNMDKTSVKGRIVDSLLKSKPITSHL